MKNLFLLLSLTLCLSVFSQNFQGMITYQTTYESKVDDITTEEMFGQKESSDTTYIKDGFYLSKSSTDFMNYLLWRSKDTMQYFRNKLSKDTVWYDKTNSHPSNFDSTNIEENVDSILGYHCNKLIVYTGNQTYEYYYNPDFKLEPKCYSQYLNISKYNIMKIMQSPYLRLKVSSPINSMDMIAVNILIESLSDSIFQIPDGELVKFEY